MLSQLIESNQIIWMMVPASIPSHNQYITLLFSQLFTPQLTLLLTPFLTPLLSLLLIPLTLAIMYILPSTSADICHETLMGECVVNTELWFINFGKPFISLVSICNHITPSKYIIHYTWSHEPSIITLNNILLFSPTAP